MICCCREPTRTPTLIPHDHRRDHAPPAGASATHEAPPAPASNSNALPAQHSASPAADALTKNDPGDALDDARSPRDRQLDHRARAKKEIEEDRSNLKEASRPSSELRSGRISPPQGPHEFLHPLLVKPPTLSISRIAPQPEPPFQIFLKGLDKTTTVWVRPSDTVEAVLAIAHLMTAIPLGLMRLVHETGQLHSSQRLSDHNVRANSTLLLLLRLRGGSSAGDAATHAHTATEDSEGQTDWDDEMEALLAKEMFDYAAPMRPAQGTTRIVGMNIDGVPDSAELLTLGRTLEQMGAGVLLLGDTQRSIGNTATLELGLTNGAKSVSIEDRKQTWRHGLKSRRDGAGGVSTRLDRSLANRTAPRRAETSPHIEDQRKLGRFSGVMLLGKKANGQQKAVGIITLYAMCPGGAWAAAVKKQNEEASLKTTDPNEQLVADLADAMSVHAHPDTTWILMGDTNCRDKDPEVTPLRRRHQEAWRAFRAKFDLRCAEPEEHTCFPSHGTPSHIDHIMMSKELHASDVTIGTHTVDCFAKAEAGARLANSIHALMVLDIRLHKWLNAPDAAAPTEPIRPRTLMFKNKKQRAAYEQALDAIEDQREKDGSPSTEDLELTAAALQCETDPKLPQWADAEMRALHASMIAAEDEIAEHAVEKKRDTSKKFKLVWTPQMIIRFTNIKLLETVLRAHKDLGNRPHEVRAKIRKAVARTVYKTHNHEGVSRIDHIDTPPTRNDTSWNQWKQRVLNQIKSIRKELHARYRKDERKKISAHVRAIEKLREDHEIGKYVAKIMGARNSGQGTTLTIDSEDGNRVVDDPSELKQVLQEYTYTELGGGRERWFLHNDGSTHPVAQFTDEGDKLRNVLAHGTPEEIEEAKRMFPPCFHGILNTFKCKQGNEDMYAHVMQPITLNEWLARARAKKKNTAPGKTGTRVDHIASASERFNRKLLAMTNMSIATGTPFDLWHDELIWKLPKDPGIPSIDRMRPLKFLEITRKMVQGILKNRLQSVWFGENMLSPEQFGSMPDVSTFQPALMKRLAAEDAVFYGKELFTLDEDLTKGFDRVERFIKDSALRRFAVPESARNFLLAFDHGNRNQVITPFGLTDPFHAEAAALAQGCEASPILWVVVMDMMLEYTRSHNEAPYKYSVGADGETTDIGQILYVDDGSYLTGTEKALREVAEATQTFSSFSGLEVSTKKSWASAITHDQKGNIINGLDFTPIQLTEWRPGESGDRLSRPPDAAHKKWTVHTDTTRKPPIQWQDPTKPYRHLGNVQDMLGNSKVALQTAHDTANKLAMHLGRKRLSPAGARLMNTLVLTPKIKYSMILSNCSTCEINKTQKSVKAMLCHKHKLRSNTPDAALYGEADALQWARWGDTCQIERVKLVLQSMDQNTNVGRVMRGAIHRLQQCNGSSRPVLECNDRNQMNADKASSQWLYQVWHWMTENNVQIQHSEPAETAPRENDYRLMDRARNPRERKDIASMLPKYTWASDVITDSGGRRVTKIPVPTNANQSWSETADRICGVGNYKNTEQLLGKWISLGETAAQARRCARSEWMMQEDVLYKVVQGTRPVAAERYSPITYKVGSSTRRVTWLPSGEKLTGPWDTAEPCEVRWHGAPARPKPVQEWLQIHTLPCDECSKDMTKSQRVKQLSEHRSPELHNACYGCNATLCEQHAAETDSQHDNGQWICPRCRAQQTAAVRVETDCDSSGYIAHNMKKALTTDQQTPVPVTPELSQDDAPVPDACHVLLPTAPESGLRLYSDGSHRYREQTGTYAWEVGYYDKDLWLQIATGGGKCSQKDNPHVPLTSTRLEALGVLRGRQWIEQNQWQGKVEAWLDNESTVTRFAKHQTERHKKCWKRPDNDIWSAMREIDPTRTTLHWVEGHPEKRKAPWQYDEHEQRNVAMDKAAEEQYGTDETDRPWTAHPGKVCIDNLPIASKIKDTLAKHVRSRVTAEFFKRKCDATGNSAQLDMGIMKAIRSAESRTGMLTKCLRITHILWATNDYLEARGKRDNGKCPLCGNNGENPNHLKAHCTESVVAEIRAKMMTNIAADIEDALGDSMPEEAWQAMANLWTPQTLKTAYPDERLRTKLPACKRCRAGPNCPHRGHSNGLHLPTAEAGDAPIPQAPESENDTSAEHSEQDENEPDALSPEVRRCLQDMSAPGARTHWAGWFPTSFTALLAACGIAADDAYKLALAIRDRIMNSFDEIWRERNIKQHKPNLRKETNELIRKAHSRKLELRMKMGTHSNVEELLKLPHRTKAEWLKNTNTNIEKKLKSNRERDTARKRWEEGQLDWNPNADAPKTATSSKTKTAPKAIPKPKDLISTVNNMKWHSQAPTDIPGKAKRKTSKKSNKKGAAAPRGSNHQYSTPWAIHPQPLLGGASAAAAAAAPPPSTSHIALPPSTDKARKSRENRHTDSSRPHATSATSELRHNTPSSSTLTAPSQHPQTPMQADDPDIQHIDHHV